MAEYEELLRASITEHGGTLIKALGDGHLAACFRSAEVAAARESARESAA